jgi:hypothetical protein
MPVHLESDWGRKRRLSSEHAVDIILNCKTEADDFIFANKWRMSIASVKQIRLGKRWGKLRSKLKNEHV